jgi:16S rRNA (uracil1498-N3)-methyltransferase
MQVFLLGERARSGNSIFCEGPEAHHILKVLRLRPGDPLLFADGHGSFLHVRIDRCDGHSLHGQIERVEDDAREIGAPRATLALALLKGDHFDVALEKAVELGVHRILPLAAERCVVRLDVKGARAKVERWQRVVESAMKQAARSWLPPVEEPCDLRALPERVASGVPWIVGDEEERERTVEQACPPAGSPFLAIVGPEGGFSPSEKQWLRQQGAAAVTLSPFRLRAETAAIALLAQLCAPRGAP